MNRTTAFALANVWLLVILAACNSGNTRDFEWPAEIAQLTGRDLGTWLRGAPFSNELMQTAEHETVFTNAAQVFPFMGRYHNAVGELANTSNESNSPAYQRETVLYQDPDWGDLFVNATLLYDKEEVFLDRYYDESGNVLFGGADAAMTTHSATLVETAVSARTPAYKTAIYWADTGSARYLLGFYQQGKLVFETAIPLSASDTAAALAQLNAVNEKLGLHIAEWQRATVQQLKPTGGNETFWKDPFVGLYPEDKYMLDKVRLKIKDTPFRAAATPVRGDYYFSYDAPTGQVVLFTALRDTKADRESFGAENKGLPAYRANGQSVYYQEQQVGEEAEGVAKIYFGAGQYLELNYKYPWDDAEAKAYVHGILKHVKVSRIL